MDVRLLEKMRLNCQVFKEEISIVHLNRQVAHLQSALQESYDEVLLLIKSASLTVTPLSLFLERVEGVTSRLKPNCLELVQQFTRVKPTSAAICGKAAPNESENVWTAKNIQ